MMNSNQLKIIAIIFMAIEHVSRIASELLDMPELNYLLHYTGRIVFPIFAFLMVEGFFKTSNRKRYLTRIFSAMVIMAAGSHLVIYLTSLVLSVEASTLYHPNLLLYYIISPIGKNIFYSLAFGLLLLFLIEKFKKSTLKKDKILLSLALFFTGIFSLLSEANIHVVPLFLIFYFFYNQKKKMAIAYTLFSTIWLIEGLVLNSDYFWSFEYQWMMIAALPFFLLYNGEIGKVKMKYFFYAFYPLHLWIIFFIESYFFF